MAFRPKLARYSQCDQVMPVAVVPIASFPKQAPQPLHPYPLPPTAPYPPPQPPVCNAILTPYPSYPSDPTLGTAYTLIPGPIPVPLPIVPTRTPTILNYPPPTPPAAGSILTNSTGKTPTGYLSCDGRPVSKTEFPTLFQAIGTLYGETNVTNAFVLPNLEDLNGSGIFYIIKI